MINQQIKYKQLKSKKDFERLFSVRKSFRTKSFHFMYSLYSDELSIGFSVPKKIVSLAVNRNRLKRQMRESVREVTNQKEVKSCLVLIVFKGSKGLSFCEIKSEISKFIHHLEE